MDFTGQRMATKSDHKNLVHKNLFLSTINFGKTAIKNFRLYICLYTSASPMKAATSLAGTARTNSQSCDSFFLLVDIAHSSTFAIEKQLALKPQGVVNLISQRQLHRKSLYSSASMVFKVQFGRCKGA